MSGNGLHPTVAPPQIVTAARQARRVVAVTGAGMSAESGVPTFRDAQTGLWARYSPEELATPQAWSRDPDFVWAWYLWRLSLAGRVEPNAGHRALAEWADRDGVRLMVVTQNVDDLHERAGSRAPVHLHGSLAAFRCESCETPHTEPVLLPEGEPRRVSPPRCLYCGAAVRPGVVWFGESLPVNAWNSAVDRLRTADLVLLIGTSGMVYPAADLPSIARGEGITVVEINPQATDVSHLAHHTWRATAAVALPALVAALG